MPKNMVEGEDKKNPPPSLLNGDDSESASFSSPLEMIAVSIKQEKEDEEEDCDYLKFDARNSNGSSSSSSGFPKPMEGLHESTPPPFLNKTFDMVEDLKTNPIVSWTKNRDSFVVWDSHHFSKHLLPKYFKHSNFSSFIRQLNTYGFRKIDPDRWEFANEGFRGGNKHLLNNIKRRSRYNNNNKTHPHHKQKQLHSAMSIQGSNLAKPWVGTELDSLNKDQDLLKLEILKLRQIHQHSENQLIAVDERIRAAEYKQVEMFNFFAKAIKNPSFIQRLILKRKFDYCGEMVKQRRLLPTQKPNTSDPRDNNIINSRKQARRYLATMQSELAQVLPESDTASGSVSKLFSAPLSHEFCNPIYVQDDTAENECTDDNPEDMSSVYDLMTEDLLDENPVVDEDSDINDSKLYSELENLLATTRTRTWSGSITAFVGRAGCA
ncbi:Heat shock factor protein HSF30 [Linum perenne]